MKISKILTLIFFWILSAPCFAAFEEWQQYAANGIQIARVGNDSGSFAGVLCDTSDDGCFAYISVVADCTEGATYPMMVNSTVGALALVGTCTTIGKSKYFIFDEFEKVIDAFTSGAEFGFVMPMASGQFRVVRFSFIGASKAITKARARTGNRNTQKSLSDQSI